MSYARFAHDGSDVYVYTDIGGYLNCCGCRLNGGPFHAYNTDAMLAHLAEHTMAGHTVPDYCVAGLEEDREENDTWLNEQAR